MLSPTFTLLFLQVLGMEPGVNWAHTLAAEPHLSLVSGHTGPDRLELVSLPAVSKRLASLWLSVLAQAQAMGDLVLRMVLEDENRDLNWGSSTDPQDSQEPRSFSPTQEHTGRDTRQ